jgi:hypothetical protein
MESLKREYACFRKVRGNLPLNHLADGNCYYRALGYAYIEKLLTIGPLALKDFRDHIVRKDSYYICDDMSVIRILGGYLNQLYDRHVKKGLEAALKLLLRMIIFSEHFDYVSVMMKIVANNVFKINAS